MIRIPPPEELARRPAATPYALAALDGLVAIATFAVAGVAALGIFALAAWTIYRAVEGTFRRVAAWAGDAGHGLPPLPALLAGVAVGAAVTLALTRHTVVLKWVAARAGREFDARTTVAASIAWWAVVCGVVWAFT